MCLKSPYLRSCLSQCTLVHVYVHTHGRRKWGPVGVCRESDTPTIYVGDIDMYIPNPPRKI